jgi:hypothetical protein
MSAAPGITRLDPESIQTIRGAMNAVEAIALQEQAPVAGIFDPVRLEMLQELNGRFADAQAADTSGEVRLNPTERETARQAIGAAESLVTTAAGQQILDSIGARYTRADIPRLQGALNRISPVQDPDDLAGTDVRYRLYLDVTDPEPVSVDVREFDAFGFDPADWEQFDRCHGDPNRSIYNGYGALASLIDSYRDEGRQGRREIAITAREVIDELDFRAKENRCYTRPDRARLRLAARKAADRFEKTGSTEPLRALNDMAKWTEYRMQVGLADSR